MSSVAADAEHDPREQGGEEPSKRRRMEQGDGNGVESADVDDTSAGNGNPLQTTLARACETGPALLAEYGVFCIAQALEGHALETAQTRANENISEVLRLFALRQVLAPLKEGEQQYQEICCRDGGRYDIRFRMDEEPFRSLGEAGPWMPTIKRVLGEDLKLLFSGVVLARGGDGDGGGDDQEWHQDGGHLFGTDGEDALHLPCHCLNVFIPLVAIDERNGATQFVLGTHRADCTSADSAAALLCDAGSCIVFDYRVIHRGSANRSQADRPVLYFTYSKPWFVDAKNHRSTRSIRSVSGGGTAGKDGLAEMAKAKAA